MPLSLITAAVLLTAPAATRASEELPITWIAPAPECGTAEDLRERVTSLGARTEVVPGRLSVAAQIVQDGSGSWQLALALTDHAGVRHRMLRADRCEELVDAVAFIVAVALDPKTAEPDLGATPAPEPTPVCEPQVEATPTASNRTGLVQLGVGPRAGAWPRVAALFEAGIGVEGRGWRLMLGGNYQSAVHLSSTQADDAGADIRIGAASLRPCLLSRHGVITLPVCAAVEVGTLDAKGVGLEKNFHSRQLWFAAGVMGGLEANLGEQMFVGFEVGALAVVSRFRVTVSASESETLHVAGTAEVRALAKIGVRFP